MDKNISVVIPAYNEEKTISKVISDIKALLGQYGFESEIVVVDDGSTDDTSRIIKKLDVVIVTISPNRGYGRAIKRGIEKARYEMVMITDGDGTYTTESMKELLESRLDYDMLVGARRNIDPSLIKKPAKWFVNKLAGYITGVKIPDLNSGLRIFKREKAVRFFKLLPDGFSLTSTLTIAMLNDGDKVQYAEIEYRKRKTKSKFHPISDTINLISFIFQTTIYFNPLKVFVPLSIVLFIFGISALLYRIFYGGFGVVSVIFFLAALQILSIGLIADLIGKQLK